MSLFRITFQRKDMDCEFSYLEQHPSSHIDKMELLMDIYRKSLRYLQLQNPSAFGSILRIEEVETDDSR